MAGFQWPRQEPDSEDFDSDESGHEPEPGDWGF
jgi:hypothetical protein